MNALIWGKSSEDTDGEFGKDVLTGLKQKFSPNVAQTGFIKDKQVTI